MSAKRSERSTESKHVDPQVTERSQAGGSSYHANSYPTSMKISAIQDESIRNLVAEEKKLRAEFETVRADLRKAADAKEANLRAFMPAADEFSSSIADEIESLQREKEKAHNSMDSAKIAQNEIGQLRDELKVLDFDARDINKDIADARSEVEAAARACAQLEKQRSDAVAKFQFRSIAEVDAEGERLDREIAKAASNPVLAAALSKQRTQLDKARKELAAVTALDNRLTAENKKRQAAQGKLDAKLAEKKAKDERFTQIREKISKSSDISNQFDAARKKLKAIGEKLDVLFAKKKQQKPQNKEIDGLNKVLLDIRQRRDEITSRLDQIRASLPFRTMKYDAAYRADLVGKQGATLAQLQEDFGVAINIDTSGNGELILLGASEAVDSCMEAIRSIIANAERCRQREVISIEESLRSALIGAKGANIDKMQTVSGANIKLKDGEVTLTGTAEAIATAKRMIEELIDSSSRAEVPFDAVLLDIVIGKGGSMVRKIEQESGAKNVRVLRDESKVVISGTKDSVTKAKLMYEELISSMKNNAFTMKADDRMLRAVIGTGGKTIREIQDTTGAIVNCGKDVITIRGTKEAVAAARQKIEDVGRRDEIKVPFPSVMYGFLTTPATTTLPGGDGAEVVVTPLDAIKAHTKVDQIVALARESVAIIRGRKENANQARCMLEDLLRSNRPNVVKVVVPDVLCSYLIRRGKGAAVNALDELKSKHFDVVAITLTRGTSTVDVAAKSLEGAKEAATALEGIVAGLLPFVRTVDIPAGRAGSVIGSGGKTIHEIQTKFNVEITVKKDEDKVVVFHESGNAEKLDGAVAAIELAANSTR